MSPSALTFRRLTGTASDMPKDTKLRLKKKRLLEYLKLMKAAVGRSMTEAEKNIRMTMTKRWAGTTDTCG